MTFISFAMVLAPACGSGDDGAPAPIGSDGSASDASNLEDGGVESATDALVQSDTAVDALADGPTDDGPGADAEEEAAAPCVPGAPPAPAGLNTGLEHAKPVVLNGTCFGTKASAAPLRWDDAESSYAEVVDGATVPTDPDPASGLPFASNANDRMKFATVDSRTMRGVSNAHYIGFGADHKTNALGGHDYNPEGVGHGHQTFYLTWYVRTDTQSTSASTKLIRLWAGSHNGRTYRLSWTTMHLTYSYAADVGTESDPWAQESMPLIPSQWNTWDGEDALEQWHRLEVTFQASSAPDADDGRIRCVTDGRVEHDIALATWFAPWDPEPDYVNQHIRGGNDPLNRAGVLGLDPSVDIGDYIVELDDVYLDSTVARVEICNVQSWSERPGAKCEVQIPSQWEPDRIEFQGNQGAFEKGETLYLYVVAPDGGVNAQGFETQFP